MTAREQQMLQEQLKVLQAELAALKAKKPSAVGITLKVTDGHVNPETGKPTSKGAITLYGLQRFPITLYANQWSRLAAILAGEVKVNGETTTFAQFAADASAKGLLSVKE